MAWFLVAGITVAFGSGLPIALATPASASTYAVTATIPVGNGPDGIATDPATGNVYVANFTDGTVSVISGASGIVTATIPVGAGPADVVTDPVDGNVYVANSIDGTVSVINEASGNVTATVPVGTHPTGLGVDPANGNVYVANNGDGTVWKISDVTAGLLSTVGNPDGSSAFAVAADPQTSSIFVANPGVLGSNPTSGSVAMINAAGGGVRKVIPVGQNPYALADDASTATVYVANINGRTVSVINAVSGLVTATIPVGAVPDAVAVDDSTNTAYVTNDGDNTMSVINTASDVVTATVSVGAGPEALAVNPASGAVYVANTGNNTVSVINGPTVSTPPSSPAPTQSSSGSPGPNSVTANVTVHQAVNLSGLAGTVSFPAADPGTTTTATNSEQYTVSTSDTAGYTLMLTASGTGLASSGSGSIPNNLLTVTETGAHPGRPASQTFESAAGQSLTLGTTTGASSDNYAETWALALPSNAAAGTYSEGFVYLVLGN
jgi:YVTN family beta-propeller protein